MGGGGAHQLADVLDGDPVGLRGAERPAWILCLAHAAQSYLRRGATTDGHARPHAHARVFVRHVFNGYKVVRVDEAEVASRERVLTEIDRTLCVAFGD